MSSAENLPVEQNGGAMVPPSFMDGKEGTENLGQFIVPPRIKIVQKQSTAQFLDRFDIGDTILVPQMVVVSPVTKNEHGKSAEVGEVFSFVPIFFYPEWCVHNPYELKGTEPFIYKRTTDPNDPIATRARTQKLWLEEMPDQKDSDGKPLYRRNVEHLNFVSVITGHPELAGMPVIFSFYRGEHRAGSNLAALIRMRNAPLFGCQFEARTSFRIGPKGEWYGFDVMNPMFVEPFIQDQEVYNVYKSLHDDMKKAHSESVLQADYEDEIVDPPQDSPAEF